MRPSRLHITIHVAGTYQRIAEPGAPRPITMRLTLALARPSSGSEQVMVMSGTLDAPGLADHVPVTGTVRVSDWRRPSLEYTSTFTSNQGEPFQLRGHEQLALRSFLRMRVALHPEIREPQGHLVARCRLLARLRPVWPFRLAS